MNHPAGRIGKRLILRVRDVMLTGSALPLCPPSTLIMEVHLMAPAHSFPMPHQSMQPPTGMQPPKSNAVAHARANQAGGLVQICKPRATRGCMKTCAWPDKEADRRRPWAS